MVPIPNGSEIAGFITPDYFSAEMVLQRLVEKVVSEAVTKAMWSGSNYFQIHRELNTVEAQLIVERLQAEGFGRVNYYPPDKTLSYGINPFLGELQADALAVVSQEVSNHLMTASYDSLGVRYVWIQCPDHLKSGLAQIAEQAGWELSFDEFELRLMLFKPLQTPTPPEEIRVGEEKN